MTWFTREDIEELFAEAATRGQAERLGGSRRGWRYFRLKPPVERRKKSMEERREIRRQWERTYEQRVTRELKQARAAVAERNRSLGWITNADWLAMRRR